MASFRLTLATVVAVALSSCEAIVSDPGQEAPSGETGISLEVLTCEIDEFGGTAQVELESSRAWSLVSLKGSITDGSGAVVGQGFGNVSDVVPGQTYKTDVFYTISGSPPKDATCEVQVDYTLG